MRRSAVRFLLLHRPRLRAFLSFLLFLVVAQVVSGSLEWVLLRKLHVVETTGRPWRPSFFYVWEAAGIVGALTATWVITRLTGRSFAELGYQAGQAGRQMLIGAGLGFAIISALVLGVAALGGYSFGHMGMSVPAILGYAIAWLAAMVGTAFAGEMILHGAGLLTLADAVGFWPAAAAISVLVAVLGLGSGGNGLNYAAALNGLWVSLFACYTVRRTRAIWFACGFHALLDYTSLFVYGSPSRGNQGGEPIATRLFTGGFHGSTWLTGGAVGVQSSWLLLPIVAAAWAAYWYASSYIAMTRALNGRVRKGKIVD